MDEEEEDEEEEVEEEEVSYCQVAAVTEYYLGVCLGLVDIGTKVPCHKHLWRVEIEFHSLLTI